MSCIMITLICHVVQCARLIGWNVSNHASCVARFGQEIESGRVAEIFCVLIEHSNTGEKYRGVTENGKTVPQSEKSTSPAAQWHEPSNFIVGNKSHRSNIMLTMKLKCSVQNLMMQRCDIQECQKQTKIDNSISSVCEYWFRWLPCNVCSTNKNRK